MQMRRLASGFLALIAVQYAAFGAGPVCAAEHGPSPVADHAGGMDHTGPAPASSTNPCAPEHRDGTPTHSPVHCLAMAGCAATSVAEAISAVAMVPPQAVATATAETAQLHSTRSPPDTPPPIA